MRIQLIEDEARLATVLGESLEAKGFDVEVFHLAGPALAAQREGYYDLIILDLGLPDRHGLEVIQTMRAKGESIPVLVLSGHGEVRDRVESLDAGADDYMVKPFDLAELLSRARALMRRPPEALDVVLIAGNLTFDPVAREIRVGETEVHLTGRETALLERLLRRRGRVVHKSALVAEFFTASGQQATNSVEVLIHRLRNKLNTASAEITIRTMPGVGYKLVPGREED